MYMHYLVGFGLSTCPDHYLINIQQSSRQGVNYNCMHMVTDWYVCSWVSQIIDHAVCDDYCSDSSAVHNTHSPLTLLT